MRVRQGWSGEVRPNVWAKFSIELDEDDLERMLRSFHPVLIGLEPVDGLGHQTAFQLLELEAELLVTTKLVIRYGFDPDAGRAKIAELVERKRAMLAPIRDARTQMNVQAGEGNG